MLNNETAVPETNEQLDKKYGTTVTVYAAQIMFSIVISAVGYFMAGRFGSADQTTMTALWVLMIFVAGGTILLRRMLFNWESLKAAKLLKGEAGLLAKLQMNSIILGSMAEAVAVIGFVIVALGGDAFDIIRAGAVALIAFAINFPRKSVWQKVSEGLKSV